jgi:hypothetical protein
MAIAGNMPYDDFNVLFRHIQTRNARFLNPGATTTQKKETINPDKSDDLL